MEFSVMYAIYKIRAEQELAQSKEARDDAGTRSRTFEADLVEKRWVSFKDLMRMNEDLEDRLARKVWILDRRLNGIPFPTDLRPELRRLFEDAKEAAESVRQALYTRHHLLDQNAFNRTMTERLGRYLVFHDALNSDLGVWTAPPEAVA